MAALDDNELAARRQRSGSRSRRRRTLRARPGGSPARPGERPFDVQLVGTLAMLAGQVAEMATGEGKTLSGALAAAGYALRGRSVHVMSVNDYLARRDAEWMRPVYDLLGVTVGWIGQASTPADRRRAYDAQVTYGAVSEFGFDVLQGPPRDQPPGAHRGAARRGPDRRGRLGARRRGARPARARGRRRRRGGEPAGNGGTRPPPAAAQDYRIDDDGRSVHLTDQRDKGRGSGPRRHRPLHRPAPSDPDQAQRSPLRRKRCCAATSTTSSATAKSTSSTRPAAGSPGCNAGPTGCTRPSRRRKAWPPPRPARSSTASRSSRSSAGTPTVCGMTGTAVAVGEQLREFYGLEIAVIPPNRPCVRVDEPDRLFATVSAEGAGGRRPRRGSARRQAGRS